MTDPKTPDQKRSGGLSRGNIVQATVELLDSAGEGELTVRALTAHLATGRGAIYHYVDGKEELLAAATDHIVSAVFAGAANDADPRHAIRELALGIFDAIAAHPWVGAQLGREPLQPAVLRIWKGLGERLRQMDVTGAASADAGAALMSYLLGAAAQYAATSGKAASSNERAVYLEKFAAEMNRIDPDIRETAAAVVGHDDREQFAAGIQIFLAGIDATRASTRPSDREPDAHEL